MSDQIVLDLGEYGEILVEPTEALQTAGGVVPASRDGSGGKRRKVDAKQLLRAPLTGLGRLFMGMVPEPRPGDPYALDEFSVEFEIGIEAEVGSSLGAVAKIVPSGAMKCVYTWKQKPGIATVQTVG